MHNFSKHSYIFKFTTVGAVALAIFTALSGLLLSAPHASASDTSATINFSLEVLSACSLSATSGSDLSTTINAGDTSLIGTTSLKAVCNDNGGLAIYAIGYTGSVYGDTNLRRQEAGTLSTTNLIPTGVSVSTSYWNMTVTENTSVQSSYSPVIPLEFQSAHAVPSTYTQITSYSPTTDQTTGVNINVSYNTHANLDQPAGVYKGRVKYTLVHPALHAAPTIPAAVAHQICYYGNGEDAGAMACQTIIDGGSSTTITSGSSVTLRAPNFSKIGYGFTGWNTKEDGTGTQYGPMETIIFTQDMYDDGLMLFAQWQVAETSVTMQTFSASASPYSEMASGTVIALRDARDNNVYAVAKLPFYGNNGYANSKWWMIENLRLNHDATQGSTNAALSQGRGGVFIGLADPESDDFAASTTANTLYTTDTSSTNLRIITGSNQTYRFPRYNNSNTASRVANETSPDANIYSYGNYYTWAATVADTTQYAGTNTSYASSTSICPYGWHIPIAGNKSNFNDSEWWKLTRAVVGADPANYSSSTSPYYNNGSTTTEGADASNALRKYPINLLYSGLFNASSVSARGSGGSYWSTTVYNGSNAFDEDVYTNYVYPGSSNNYKYRGRTIRCIAN